MANPPRIRPYKTFAERARGGPVQVIAHELVLERPASVDLEVNLAPHPTFKGWVSFATFRGLSLTIEAASAGHAYLFIEDKPVNRRRPRDLSSSAALRQYTYLVDGRGLKAVTDYTSFIVRLGRGRDLHIDFAPRSPWARHILVESSTGKLSAHLNASNVVFFAVD